VISHSSRRGWLLAAVAAAVIVVDQASKWAVENFSPPGSFRVIVPGYLNFIHTDNPGVAFGMFADSETPWRAPLLIAFTLLVIAFMVWLLFTNRAGGPLGRFGMAFVLGGAAGNLLDRVLRRSVTDFIDFHVGAHHWYTFNLADAAIFIGALLILFEISYDWRHTRQEHA